MRIIKVLLALCLLLNLSGGCVKRPKGVLSDNKMAEVMADMEIAEAYVETQQMPAEMESIEARGLRESFNRQELYKQSMRASVLKRHKVSQEDFDSTVAWYGRNVDAFYKLDTKIQANIAKRRQRLIGKAASTSTSRQESTASDIWPYGRMAIISERSGDRLMQFSFEGDGLQPGDRLEWKSRLHKDVEIDVVFGVQYDNGEVSLMSRTINGQRRFEFTLQTDTSRNVSRTFGSLWVRDKKDTPLWIDSISLKALPFDSTKYSSIFMQKKLQ